MEEMIEEGFVPWASKKGAILQKYTTDQTVGIMAAFMQGETVCLLWGCAHVARC